MRRCALNDIEMLNAVEFSLILQKRMKLMEKKSIVDAQLNCLIFMVLLKNDASFIIGSNFLRSLQINEGTLTSIGRYISFLEPKLEIWYLEKNVTALMSIVQLTLSDKEPSQKRSREIYFTLLSYTV